MQPATTVRFAPEIREQLDKMAEQRDRDPLLGLSREAVAQYLERETRFCAEMQKGLDDMEAGRVISHTGVAMRLKAKGFKVASQPFTN